VASYIAVSASSSNSAPSSRAGTCRAASAAGRGSRSIRWYRNSRSEYDLLAESTAGRCGRPAPTTMTGSADWLSSWQAAQIAETSSAPRSCISSMKTATPRPTSAASPPTSVSSSTRSISMSPESARPVSAGTSMPGFHRSRSLAPGCARCAHVHVRHRGGGLAERLAGPGLDLAGSPAGADRGGPQRVAQHGLADAAQAGAHHRALRPAPAGPLEDDAEGLQLLVTAGEL